MSKFVDYLLLKEPASVQRDPLGGGIQFKTIQGGQAKAVSSERIVFSLIGIVTGIFLSFVIVGINPPGSGSGGGGQKPPQTVPSIVDSTHNDKTQKTASDEQSTIRPGIKYIAWGDLWKIGLITLVICGLTYQGLYLNLKLYVDEPAFLTIFVAFQYGFFWQAVIHGSASLIS